MKKLYTYLELDYIAQRQARMDYHTTWSGTNEDGVMLTMADIAAILADDTDAVYNIRGQYIENIID
jgi:hypothetical protein